MNHLLNFRAATETDIPAMSEIRLAVTENALSDPGKLPPAIYSDYLERLGKGWVCECDGRIAGFSYAAKADSSIWALFVRPGYEGLGIGKALLGLAVDYLFSLGNDKVVLSTTAHTRADKFYAASGWQRGEMKDAVEVYYCLRNDSNRTAE